MFWSALVGTYAFLAFLATWGGVGWAIRIETIGATNFVRIAYNPVLWLPAALGAADGGDWAWLNTAYWLTVAVLAAVALDRLARRRVDRRAGPLALRARRPEAAPAGPGPRDPRAASGGPRAPARSGSGLRDRAPRSPT